MLANAGGCSRVLRQLVGVLTDAPDDAAAAAAEDEPDAEPDGPGAGATDAARCLRSLRLSLPADVERPHTRQKQNPRVVYRRAPAAAAVQCSLNSPSTPTLPALRLDRKNNLTSSSLPTSIVG